MDLFEREQKIFDDAEQYFEEVQNGGSFDVAEFKTLTKEYGRLLRQMRKLTRLSDRTAGGLNVTKTDLQDKVNFDSLTGIHNRRYMEEFLTNTMKDMSVVSGTVSVLMIDVDFFKRYNDTYGHSAGDDCLRLVAKSLGEGIVRASDCVARYGGEEFAVILPNTNKKGACIIAKRILNNVIGQKIIHEGNDAAKWVTVSVGVTTGQVKKPEAGSAFIEYADKALYIAKNSGRNQFAFIDFEGDIE